MALRVVYSVDTFGRKSFAATMGGWHTYGDTVQQDFSVPFINRHPLDRKNNDGPGWTRNRTTSSRDLYRPVPYKQVSPAPLSVDAGYYVAQFDEDDEEWNWYTDAVTIDVTPQFAAPGAPVEPDTTFAAQPHYGDEIETLERQEIVDYLVLLEQNEWIAPPEAPSTEIIAAQPYFEDFTSLVPEETVDYAAVPEQLEFLAPPEVRIPELLAAQPHYGEDFDDALETDDYQPETDAVVAFLFPQFVSEPVETFAAQPHYGEDLDTLVPEEIEDYLAPAEQLEFLAPSEIVVPEIAAATELREQAWFPDTETEDYAPDLLEVPALYPATAQEPVETFAAQALYGGEWFWEQQETEDYQPETDTLAAFLAPVPEPVETFASQPHYGEAFWPEAETEDYQTEVDISALTFPPPAPIAEVISANYFTSFGNVEALEPESLEDYQHHSVIDITFLIPAPPPPNGLPVCGPDLVIAAFDGLADVTATQGDGVLVAVGADMTLSVTNGDGELLGTEGDADITCPS